MRNSKRYSNSGSLEDTNPLPTEGQRRAYSSRPHRVQPGEIDYDNYYGGTYDEYRSGGRPPRKRGIFKKVLAVLLVIVLLIAADGIYLLSIYDYDSTDASALTFDDSGITNIALFGVDSREATEGQGTRADAIMVMSVNSKTGQVKLISLMRDSYVNVPGYGMTKICHSYSYGGPQLTMETINQDYGMNISEYITVDFGQMAAIIDSVGGVTVKLTKAERKETNKYIKEYCKENGISYKKNKIRKSGTQKLNGVQAMTYGRIRKGNTGGDWSRTERQSVVLEQVFAKATSGNPITLLRFVNGLMPNVVTSLSKQDFISLGLKSVSHGKPSMEHIRLPLDGEWQYSTTSNGMSVITFSDDVLSQHMHDYIYNDVTPEVG